MTLEAEQRMTVAYDEKTISQNGRQRTFQSSFRKVENNLSWVSFPEFFNTYLSSKNFLR